MDQKGGCEKEFVSSLSDEERKALEAASSPELEVDLSPEEAAAMAYERVSQLGVMGDQISEEEHDQRVSDFKSGSNRK